MPLSPCALGSVVARRMAQAQVCAVWGPLVPLPLERSGTGGKGSPDHRGSSELQPETTAPSGETWGSPVHRAVVSAQWT